MSVRSSLPAIARGNVLGRRGVREIALIGGLYVFYCVTRTFAEDYSPARWALVVSCVIALACYLLLPTAPPRMTGGGYVDILSLHSDIGWWSTDASAPKGMGQLTNELAAFPSLHAGWALWVAL